MGLLVLALIVVPLAELFVIIQIGSLIGALPTIGLLMMFSIGGGWLVRREGRNAWLKFTQSINAARVPAKETADGALIVLAGALLLTPGFLTDAAGILLLLPPVRAALRTFAAARLLGGGWRGVAFTAASNATSSGSGFRGRAQQEPPARRSYDVDGTAVDADAKPLKR
jgi:UPF0716 protein FxsA